MKTTALVLALGGALLSQPIVAYAGQSCGGGGGGGGSSSSSGSDSGGGGGYDSDSSWSASSTSYIGEGAPTTATCIDDTDVVGYRHCTKFGSGWGMNVKLPTVFVELGTNVRQFGGGMSGGKTGTVWHGAEQFAYRMVTPTGSDPGASAVASNLRVGVGLARGIYAGLEGEIGALTTSPAQVEMMSSGVFGTPEVGAKTAMLFGGGAFVGARVSSGRATLSIEGAGGVRDVRYRYSSSYHNCLDQASVDVVQPILEARARGELWLNPWFTLGAQAGANALARGDWMTGLYLGIHSRAFGGR